MSESPDRGDPGVLLGREFTSAVVMFHEAVGRLLGLSAAERKCLDVLDRLGPVTAGRIAEHTGLTTGAITGMIDRLTRAGYVERRPNPADRRSVLVALCPDSPSDHILPKVFGPLAADMTELSKHFTPEQLAIVATYLARTTEVLHHRTEELAHLDTGRLASSDGLIERRPSKRPLQHPDTPSHPPNGGRSADN